MADMLFTEFTETAKRASGEIELSEGLWQMVENCRDARAHLAAEAEACRIEALELAPNADSENIVLSILNGEPERCSLDRGRLAVLKLVQAKEFFVNARIMSDHELKLYFQLKRYAHYENADMLEQNVRRVEEERQGYIHAIKEINDMEESLPIAKLGLNSIWRE